MPTLPQTITNQPLAKHLLQNTKANIYLVGGCVRDMLLKREIKDIDLVIANIPINTLEKILSKFGKVDLVGKHFGVLKFKPDQGSDNYLDIALPRQEKSTSLKGIHQDFIIQSDHKLKIEADLSRRDFTINSMAYDLRQKKLIDLYSGQKDLNKKIIRTTGDPKLRFSEDYARIMRAIRFACQLNFTIAPDSLKVIKTFANKINNQKALPKEILASELLQALDANAPKCINLLQKTNLIKYIVPGLLKTSPKFNQTLKITQQKVQPNFLSSQYLTISLTTIFLYLNKNKRIINFKTAINQSQQIIKKLALTSPAQYNIKSKNITFLIKQIADFENKPVRDYSLLELEQILINNEAGHLLLPTLKLLAIFYRQAECQKLYNALNRKYKKLLLAPKPFLNGNQVQQLLGIKDSPQVGIVLEKIRNAQLSGQVKTKKQAEVFVKSKRM